MCCINSETRLLKIGIQTLRRVAFKYNPRLQHSRLTETSVMDQRLLDYLQRILNARVYDVAIESPLDPAQKLSARMGNQIWLKREDTQPVHSFKLRGAYKNCPPLIVGTRQRCHLLLGGEPCPGGRPQCPSSGLSGSHRHARHDSQTEVGCSPRVDCEPRLSSVSPLRACDSREHFTHSRFRTGRYIRC